MKKLLLTLLILSSVQFTRANQNLESSPPRNNSIDARAIHFQNDAAVRPLNKFLFGVQVTGILCINKEELNDGVYSHEDFGRAKFIFGTRLTPGTSLGLGFGIRRQFIRPLTLMEFSADLRIRTSQKPSAFLFVFDPGFAFASNAQNANFVFMSPAVGYAYRGRAGGDFNVALGLDFAFAQRRENFNSFEYVNTTITGLSLSLMKAF